MPETQALEQPQTQAPRKQWMQLFCFFCVNEKMQYLSQRRYLDDSDQYVIESHAICQQCGYQVMTIVPYKQALRVVDVECLPTEEQIRVGGY